ncbi:hypothetical protein B0H14DRAFT_1121336 [Mycena olivaceomarginata]|nr:hypothetical protein B0H14DRAFT_1121336 [Mycena olivaceomarginata]
MIVLSMRAATLLAASEPAALTVSSEIETACLTSRSNSPRLGGSIDIFLPAYLPFRVLSGRMCLTALDGHGYLATEPRIQYAKTRSRVFNGRNLGEVHFSCCAVRLPGYTPYPRNSVCKIQS